MVMKEYGFTERNLYFSRLTNLWVLGVGVCHYRGMGYYRVDCTGILLTS